MSVHQILRVLRVAGSGVLTWHLITANHANLHAPNCLQHCQGNGDAHLDEDSGLVVAVSAEHLHAHASAHVQNLQATIGMQIPALSLRYVTCHLSHLGLQQISTPRTC